MGNVSVFKNRKTRGILALILIAIIIVGAVCVLHGIHRRNVERDLDDLQEQVLAELERNAGTYDEQSIALYDTSEYEAKKLAERFGATLRLSSNGRFATLTLPEGTTIVDIYKDDGNRVYLEKMSIDYQVRTTLITDEEGNGVHNTSAPNYTVTDGYYNLQDYINYLHVGDAWSSYRGNGVTVAVIDTGIDTDHPEFAGRISEKSYNATEDKIVKDYLLEGDVYDWSLIEDEQGHGTAVTGVIAAAMNGEGVVGVAPEVTIIVIKAECDANGNFLRSSDLVFGLYYAIEAGADVVNMSFGVYSTNPFASPLRLAVDNDILCVAAAGNDGTTSLTYPAADPNCIAVGALAQDSWELAAYSNYGENVNIVAPGTTFTTQKGGGYGIMNGTSLASPIVAGAMALLKQQNRWIEFAEAQELLYASTYDLGSLGEDFYYGYGALDVAALLTEQRGTVTFNYLTDEIEETTQVFIRNHTLQNLPEPDRNFCVFDGWYYDIYCTEEVEWYADEWTSDLTLYAKWANEDDGVPYTYVTLDDGTIEIRSYTGHRRYITIPDIIDEKPVTSIGDFAFDGQSRLRQVTLPSGLKKIGDYAFYNCNNLLDMTFPDGVTEIGDYAFYNTVRLSQVAFGSGSKLESVGNFAFGFSGLTRFDIPAKLVSVNGSAFYGATKLRDIFVARENTAFRSFDGVLADATGALLVAYPAAKGMSYALPDGVTEIGAYAFAYARLTEVDLNNAQKIGEAAFTGSSLEELTLGEKIVSLGGAAFSYNYNLRSVSFAETINLAVIPKEAFAYCFSLTSVEIPASVMVVDYAAFAGDVSLASVSFADGARLLGIGESAFASCTALGGIEIPASVLSIGDRAFEKDSLLASVSFEEGSLLSSIGDKAFADTVALTGIVFPENLATIGAYAFLDGGLTGEITLPANLGSLGEGAFASCHALTAIGIADENAVYTSVGGVLYNKGKTLLAAYPAGRVATSYTPESTTERIGNAAFYGAWNLTGVTINDGVTAVGEYAFCDCKNVTSYNLPSSLTAIERYAFAKNAKLTGVSIPDNVVQIGAYAFAGDYRMTSVYFGTESKLPRISFAAFSDTGIYSFTVPKNVSTIAQYAFSGSKNLQSIFFAENSKLTTVSAYLFDGCDALLTITFGSGSALTSIQAHGFEGMRNLQTVDFGDAALASIGNYAFRYCENLTSVTIPGTVTSIGRYAFYGAKRISRFDIPGSVEQIGRYAFYGTNNANVYFTSDELPETLQECWDEGIAGYYVGVTNVETAGDWTYATLRSGGIALLSYTGDATELDLTALDLGGAIRQIGGYAFYRSSVETVVLPETVEKILAYAFAYSNLQTVTVPANVGFIGKYAFFHATDLTAVAFAEGSRLKTLEQYAFGYTGSLANITLPASLATMGSSVFEKSGIASVTFADGIALTEIPEGAFMGSALTSVRVPASVTKIDHNAFRDCLALGTVVFDCENVEILSNVFYNSGLHTVEIGANVAYIGEYAFVGLTNLTAFSVSPENARYASVDGVLYSKDGKKLIAMPAGRTGNFTVPNTVETIGFGAFENTALSAVSFEEGINLLTIGYRAFYNSSSLVEITVPESVVSIDYYAFAMCKNLTTVTFAGDNLRGVYEGAFYGDRNLKNITLPDEIVEISDFAFYGCSSLTALPISKTNELRGIYDYAFAYSGITDLTLPDSVTDVGAYAFMGLKIKELVIPTANQKNLVIGIGAFRECEELEVLDLPFIGSCYEDEEFGWFGYIFGAGRVDANATYVPRSLKKVSIGVTAPDNWDRVFGTSKEYFANLEEIVLPEGLTGIGGEAFSRCSSLTSVAIPNSVTSIGRYAFLNCSSLTSVTIPDGVTSIGSAFTGCSSLYQVVNHSDLELTIGSGIALYAKVLIDKNGNKTYRTDGSDLEYIDTVDGFLFEKENGAYRLVAYLGGEETVTLPADVNGNAYTVYRMRGVKNVIIPNGWMTIDAFAFFGCHSLTSITIPDSVTSIGLEAFWGCSSLTSVTIGNGVTSIYSCAFYGCSSLTSIEIPDSVTSIGAQAFLDCSSLMSVTIGNGVTNIGNDTFRGCSSLMSVTIGNGVTSIGEQAFYGCSSLTSVTIPDGVTSIGDWAFDGCSSLTSVTIPDSVTSISISAFWGCSSLTDLRISEANPNFVALDGVIYNIEITQNVFVSNAVTDLVVPNTVTSIYLHELTALRSVSFESGSRIAEIVARGCTSLASIEIPESVTCIYSDAFYGCSSLTSVTIPNSVTSIGSSVFWGCSSLTGVTIPDSVTSIGGFAFYGCRSLTSVTIGNSVTSIGYDAFEGCSSLTSVTIPDSVTNIGSSAFRDCSSLTSVVIPDSVTSIGSGAFYGCSSLTSITIPDSVTSIGGYAFSGCSSLISVTIPDGVTSIGGYAFNSCYGLASVTLPNSVTSIGDSAFGSCYSLYQVVNYSDLELTIGLGTYGCIAENAKVLIDKNGNKIYRTDGSDFEYIDTVDGFRFAKENGAYRLVAYLSGEETVTLPADVNGNAYTVYSLSNVKNVIIPDGWTVIDDSAFWGCSSLTSITIPDSVTSIGTEAFYGCSSLTSVTIPDSVTSIGSAAFRYCSNLTSVTIGNGVTSIGNDTFRDCSSLTSVTIPDSVISISGSAFSRTAYYDDPSNWENGTLYIGKHLIAVDPSITYLTLREDTGSIADGAFAGCYSLKSVNIGGNHSRVFSSLTNLETLIIDEMPWHYVYNYFGDSVSDVPITLKNVILKKGCDVRSASAFAGVTGVTIYVEEDALNVQWDRDYPGWNNGNKVYYGGKWIEALFKDNRGNVISDMYYTTSQIIRQPYVEDYYGTANSVFFFEGWDLDNDGCADFLPAVSSVSIEAKAAFSEFEFCEVYGHDLIHHDAKAATCTAIGWTAYDTCSRCDYTTYAELPALGHDLTHHDAKAPTCTAIGWTAYDTCSRCDYTTYAELSALGHTSSGWIVDIAPSCTAEGLKHKECTVCHEVLVSEEIALKAHEYGAWSQTKAPTCTEKGIEKRICGNCDRYETRDVDALGHDYQATVTPPTQTERGYTTHVCSRCGDSYADSYVDALEVGESRKLLQELTATLDRIATVGLNSYSTLKDVYDRSTSLTDADRATLNAKLAPMMEEYTRLAQQINAEYSAAEEIESTYFVVILGAVQALAVLAFVSMKGKRWF